MYLKRFCGPDGQLFVQRRDGATFETGTNNIAVECGFYDVDVGDGEVSKHVEYLLGDLEGKAAEALSSIDATGKAPAPGTEERDVLSAFLATQHTRTPEQRERVSFWEHLEEYLGGAEPTFDLVKSFLSDEHLHEEPSDLEVQTVLSVVQVGSTMPGGPLDKNASIDLMISGLPGLADVISSYNWTVEHERKGRLITSDSPLILWRPPTPRDEFEGIGLESATELRFPLDPEKQLVLSRLNRPPSVRITPRRAVECNATVIADCHRFCIATPANRSRVVETPMKDHHPVMRFNTAPLYVRNEEGQLERQNDQEIIHM